MDFNYLTNIAIEAARSAGEIIKQNYTIDVVVEEKKGGSGYASQVVTKIDRECENLIFSYLKPTCQKFDIALLSEETQDDGSRFEKDFFWCIDPLDGTLPFINKKPGFSVSIALVRKDGTPQIGVVFDPSTNNLYTSIKGKGAHKNGKTWKVKNQNNYLTYVTDKTLANTLNTSDIQKILEKYKSTLKLNRIKEISGAGAVLNAILVIENGPAVFIKLPKKENGGGSLWDFAATACIFNELQFTATNFNGHKLDLNRRESTFMNHEGIFYSNLIDKKV